MQFELKRLAPLTAGKVLAALYAIITLVFLPFVLIGVIVKGGLAVMIPFIIIWIAYPLLGFVAGVIIAFIYNLAAKWIGGLRFTLKQVE